MDFRHSSVQPRSQGSSLFLKDHVNYMIVTPRTYSAVHGRLNGDFIRDRNFGTSGKCGAFTEMTRSSLSYFSHFFCSEVRRMVSEFNAQTRYGYQPNFFKQPFREESPGKLSADVAQSIEVKLLKNTV